MWKLNLIDIDVIAQRHSFSNHMAQTKKKLSKIKMMTSMNLPTLSYDHVTNSLLPGIWFWGLNISYI